MKVGALTAAVCVSLLLVACRGATASPGPSPSLPITDLSSFRLPSPTPSLPPDTPTATPTPTTTPLKTPTLAPPSPTATSAPTSTLAPSAPPSAVAGATPAADCVDGWTAPAAGSAEYTAALDMIESEMGVTGPWTVDEMRYFTGPDVPWILEPHYDVVDYWYVRAGLVEDPTFRARWLLEQRTDIIRGISAVAPYDTSGYKSPDWTGFVGEGTPQIVTGLPGTWAGIPYDFVTGEGDSGQPGLPDEVTGCLRGT